MKKLFLSVAIIATVSIAGWNNYIQNKQNVNLSNLALENINALASGEGDPSIDCCSSCDGAYCGVFIDVKGDSTPVYWK